VAIKPDRTSLCIYQQIYIRATQLPPFVAPWRSRGGGKGSGGGGGGDDGTHAEETTARRVLTGAKRHAGYESLKRKPQYYQCMTVVLPRGFGARTR